MGKSNLSTKLFLNQAPLKKPIDPRAAPGYNQTSGVSHNPFGHYI